MYAALKLTALAVGFLIIMGFGIYLVGEYYPDLFFYNPTYKKNTELRGYLLTDEQIVQAGNFFGQNQQFYPKQLNFDQLDKNKKTFVVIFAKNTGRKQAWGTLGCKVKNQSFEVPVFGLNSRMEESAVWVVPTGSTIAGAGPEQPEVSVKWAKLYVK